MNCSATRQCLTDEMHNYAIALLIFAKLNYYCYTVSLKLFSVAAEHFGSMNACVQSVTFSMRWVQKQYQANTEKAR